MSRARGSADEMLVSGKRRRARADMKYFDCRFLKEVKRCCGAVMDIAELERCYLMIRVVDVTMTHAVTPDTKVATSSSCQRAAHDRNRYRHSTKSHMYDPLMQQRLRSIQPA
jgi:hypothetical protein